MNLNAICKKYGVITAEERFQLIMAASARNDVVERERLVGAGSKIKVEWQDHAPFAQAFDETAHMIYLELLDAMCEYLTAFDQAMLNSHCGCADERQSPKRAKSVDETYDRRIKRNRRRRAQPDEHYLDYAMAAGHIFRTKWKGWQLFCERMKIPPLLLWDCLPGCDRLKRAAALTEKAAFTDEGFVRWLNRTLPFGSPRIQKSPMTPEVIAREISVLYENRLEWWTP